jgi:hypothetical protein
VSNKQPRDRSPAVDVPEADALEQGVSENPDGPPDIPVDVPEADALEQARDADLDDEDYRP